MPRYEVSDMMPWVYQYVTAPALSISGTVNALPAMQQAQGDPYISILPSQKVWPTGQRSKSCSSLGFHPETPC